MSAVFDDAGGRVFFSNAGRSLEGDDEIRLISVGVDIGSSTSHLVFSRIVMERLDARYVVSEREVFYNSDILLTPYTDTNTIDAEALGAFIAHSYKDAMITPEEIDTGALILTGVAVARSNARRIGDVFAREAGKLVAVSAGDSLETVLAAHGSGAVALNPRRQGGAECGRRRRYVQDRGVHGGPRCGRNRDRRWCPADLFCGRRDHHAG